MTKYPTTAASEKNVLRLSIKKMNNAKIQVKNIKGTYYIAPASSISDDSSIDRVQAQRDAHVAALKLGFVLGETTSRVFAIPQHLINTGMNYKEWVAFSTPESCGKYGAKFGRSSTHTFDQVCDEPDLRTRKLVMIGAYDAGGVYWGLGEAMYLTYSPDGEVKIYHRGPRPKD